MTSATPTAYSRLRLAAARLHSAAIHVLRRLRTVDEASGLGPARLSALSVLVFGGPCTLGELAAAEQVTPPSMSRVAGALEEAGLVKREADPRDGRAIRLSATDAGRKILEEARDRRVEVLADLLADLDQPDVESIERTVELIETALQAERRSPR